MSINYTYILTSFGRLRTQICLYVHVSNSDQKWSMQFETGNQNLLTKACNVSSAQALCMTKRSL